MPPHTHTHTCTHFLWYGIHLFLFVFIHLIFNLSLHFYEFRSVNPSESMSLLKPQHKPLGFNNISSKYTDTLCRIACLLRHLAAAQLLRNLTIMQPNIPASEKAQKTAPHKTRFFFSAYVYLPEALRSMML